MLFIVALTLAGSSSKSIAWSAGVENGGRWL